MALYYGALYIRSFEVREVIVYISGDTMIDIYETEESEHNFGFVKSPISTAMTKTYLRDKKFSNGFKGGDCTDVSPDSWGVLDRMTKYLDRSGGTGLAIKDQKIIQPMCGPSAADLSADVDFKFLKEAILKGSV
ncbi:hypothetical protein MFLAVUS_001140 [Mucor flavus]|uniref:Uncharacterized protein n=1 Tax=Mucor flavus TaxID=439312 RepID=A0ABP9YLM4_9FUNG